MPTPVIVGGIEAAGTLGATLLSKSSQDKATDAAEAARLQALEFEKEKEKQRIREAQEARDRYNRNYEDYLRRHSEWEANRRRRLAAIRSYTPW
jgi:sugar (pentulose or hexulose) kinase